MNLYIVTINQESFWNTERTTYENENDKKKSIRIKTIIYFKKYGNL